MKRLPSVFAGLLVSLLLLGTWCRAFAHRPDVLGSGALFYMTDSAASIRSFAAHASQISILAPTGYEIDSDGTVYGEVDARILSIAKKNHVPVMPLIQTFDQGDIHAFLTNGAAKQRAISIMMYNAHKYGYVGWQFDFENIRMTDKDAYASFVSEAADALHKHGLKLSVAVVKSTEPVPPADTSGYSRFLYENWGGAFDLVKLSSVCDFISFMAYDENMSLTPPGPVAGALWMTNMAKYLISLGIDPRKVSFGIPDYSGYWMATYDGKHTPHSTEKSLGFAAATSIVESHHVGTAWMAPADVHYAYWPGPDGVYRWMFLEDVDSFKVKLRLVRRYHFGGFSVWVLGDEDPRIWQVLARH